MITCLPCHPHQTRSTWIYLVRLPHPRQSEGSCNAPFTRPVIGSEAAEDRPLAESPDDEPEPVPWPNAELSAPTRIRIRMTVSMGWRLTHRRRGAIGAGVAAVGWVAGRLIGLPQLG